MYRTASNFKTTADVVFSGQLSAEQRSALVATFSSDGFDFGQIIPGLVQLPDLQNVDATMWVPNDDHVWHDVVGIDLTEDKPTDARSIEDFAAEMAQVTWDENYRSPFYDDMVEAHAEYLAQDSEGLEM
jgi:hypothetical protein